MGYEVEQKFRAADHAGLVTRLLGLGAIASPAVIQEDSYLAHPSRDFAETGEAFRIRSVGKSNAITYKGPRQPGPTKTRPEWELACEPGDSGAEKLRAILNALGFRPVRTIRKSRTAYRLSVSGLSVEVALDVAEGLGTFAEVECLAESEDDLAEAQGIVLKVAGELGLSDLEPRSYLRMALELEAAEADR